MGAIQSVARASAGSTHASATRPSMTTSSSSRRQGMPASPEPSRPAASADLSSPPSPASSSPQLGRPPAFLQRQHRCDECPVEETEVVVKVEAAPSVVETPAAAVAQEGVDEPLECVICLNELGGVDDPGSTLLCGHRFHAQCVDEWLAKDGRCPVCRQRMREQLTEARADPVQTTAGLRAIAATAMLVLESRRLMMLAAMEGALAVLVMSYVNNLVSPLLMILAALVTFIGASHYLPRVIHLARALLMTNAIYHIFLISSVARSRTEGNDQPSFLSQNAVLLAIACIGFMEVAILQKCALFLARLRLAPAPELNALRTQRRLQMGWTQKFIISALFVLITAPVIAGYVCNQWRGGAPGQC